MVSQVFDTTISTTTMVTFDGVPLIVPNVGKGFEFPHPTFDGFPSRCGAGQGLGDAIVPEKILGLLISPACSIHDDDFGMAEPTWEAFHACNYRFLYNINSIIKYRSKSVVLKHLRMYRAVTYFNAVDTLGAKCFWDLKREQSYGSGIILPEGN